MHSKFTHKISTFATYLNAKVHVTIEELAKWSNELIC